MGGMASKRNSHTYVDEGKHPSGGRQKPAGAAYRSRRNSTMDDGLPLVPDVGDEQQNGAASYGKSAVSSSQCAAFAVKESVSLILSSSRVGDPTAATSSVVSMIPPVKPTDSPAPLNGRPVNFGVVAPGVYRSSFPKPEDFAFLQNLKLKTVITLAKKDDLDGELRSFISSHGIHHIVFDMQGTKKEVIPIHTMASILHLALDEERHPLLLHCNHGKHRTGCVVAAIRKLAGWDIHTILDEYRTYAKPKVRECDVDYIRSILPAALRMAATSSPNGQTSLYGRTFLRTLLFSTFVMVLWLVSGSQLPLASVTLSS